MDDWVIEAVDITKIYQMGEVEVHALKRCKSYHYNG